MDRRIFIGIFAILFIVCIASAQDYSAGEGYDPDRVFEVYEGELVRLKLDARDPDGDEITYRFSPPLDEQGEWQTGFQDAGEYETQITVIDSRGKETSEDILIVVNDVNHLPDFMGVKDRITVDEGELLDLDLPEKDIDGDTVEYDIRGVVDSEGRWQTGFDDAGEYEVTITARDGRFAEDGNPVSVTRTIRITVNDVDRGPDIGDIERTVFEGEELEIRFPEEDPDGDEITYTADILPEGAVLGDNELEWTPGYDTIVEEDISIYIVSYRVALKERTHSGTRTFVIPMKAVSGDSEKRFNVTVTVMNRNRAPVITGIDEEISIQETESITLDANITDPDNDPVSVSYFLGDTELKNSRFVTDYESEGEYLVTIRADDGNLTAERYIEIEVENRNRPPRFKADRVTVQEGEKVSVSIEAVDDDGQDVQIRALGLPRKVDFDSRGNVVEFEPKFNFVPHDENHTANFIDYSLNTIFGTKRFQRRLDLPFELDDGIDEIEANFTIIVEDVNRAPVLEDVKDLIRVREGEPLYIPLRGYDPDSDELTYRFKGLVSRNNQTIGYDKQGLHNVTIIVTDRQAEASTSTTVEVIDMNRPPEFSLESCRVKEGETLRIPLKAADPDNDPVSFSIIRAPEDARIENNTLVWTAPHYTVPHYVRDENNTRIRNPVDYNDFLFELAASDKDYDTIVNTTVRIYDVNRPPELRDWYPATRFRIKRGEKIEFWVNVVDPDSDELTYTWYPGRFSGIEDDNRHVCRLLTPGLRDFKVVASDGEEEVEKAWQYYVR